MRLSKLQMPPFANERNDFATERVKQLRDRDAVIRSAINQNDALSETKTSRQMSGGGRPGVAVATSNGAAYVELVPAPDPGVSRLVNFVSVFDGYISGSPIGIRLTLYNGVLHYWLHVDASVSTLDSIFYPNYVSNRPIVLEDPWSLRFYCDTAGAGSDLDLVAFYADDVPRASGVSNWHMDNALKDDTDWIALVDSPAEHKVRLVHFVTFDNQDGNGHEVRHAMYDIANTTRYIMSEVSTASGTTNLLFGGRQVVTVPYGWQLQFQGGSAYGSYWVTSTAHYLEVDEDDSGEG